MSDEQGGYQPGGPALSPRVREQLLGRRNRFAAAWRRDPAREVALLVLLLVALAAIFTVALGFKQHQFAQTGQLPDQTFWMESAQRYRYIEMVADGKGIPQLDRRMQAPDGYAPRSDTVLQEIFLGRLHRRFAPEGLELTPFVRSVTRLLSASAVFPVALLCFGVTRRRDAALLGALLWALALPVAERGTGAVIFREDLAVPVLLWHLGFLALWVRRSSLLPALLSGAFLALSLLLWKVVTFYFLLLVGFLGTAHWLRREEPGRLLAGGLLLLLPSAAAALLPLSLHYDSFLTSTAALAGLAVLAALGLDCLGTMRSRKRGDSGQPGGLRWMLLAAAAFAGLRALLPGESGYDHAWETIRAKVQYLGVKPSDPGELSFHARHYWTGNYESPSLALLARNWPWLLLTALPGALLVLRWWRPRTARALDSEEPAPEPLPIALLEGLGPSKPLGGLASHFVLWLSLAFVGSYLGFRKFQLLAAIPLVVLAALGFSGFRRFRAPVRLGIVVGACLLAGQSWGLVPDMGRVLALTPQQEAGAWSPVVVSSPQSFDELARALPEIVGEDEPVLASFVISPFILTYSERPTVLHCFFEGDVLERYEAVTEARFEGEDALWEVARRYGAKWYVHEAHHLLRTDGRMSQRYVADRLEWPHESALVAMQYAPQRLQHFELAWENDWYRVFRVMEEGERRGSVRSDWRRPAWNPRIFEALFGSPFEPVEKLAGFPLGSSDLLYSTLWGQRAVRYAGYERGRGDAAGPRAERFLQEALRVAPYLHEAEDLLADLYRARGDHERAAEHRQRALDLRRALSGQAPLGSGLRPARVPLQGG